MTDTLPEIVAQGLEACDRAIVVGFRDGETGMVEVNREGEVPSREEASEALAAAIDHLVEVRARVEGCEPWQARWR